MKPSDDDDQATAPEDGEDQYITVGDEVINTDINQNIHRGRCYYDLSY